MTKLRIIAITLNRELVIRKLKYFWGVKDFILNVYIYKKLIVLNLPNSLKLKIYRQK